MPKTWRPVASACFVSLVVVMAGVGCSDDPPPPKAEKTSKSAKTSPKSDAKAKKKAAGKGKKGGDHKGRSSGSAPHTLPGELSKSDRDAGMLARCSDKKLVFGFWQGEYPSPVLQLDRPLRTKVLADPCGGTVEKGCTAPAGLYHPWAKDSDRPGDLRFAVRTMPETYTLSKDHTVAGRPLKKGTEVQVLTYLSEGFCTMTAEGVVLEDMCPGTSPGDTTWQKVGSGNDQPVQMVEVACDGGSKGWLVVDDDLMKQAGVREGQMEGYGEVSRTP